MARIFTRAPLPARCECPKVTTVMGPDVEHEDVMSLGSRLDLKIFDYPIRF
jgi:hypothetical protein